MMVVQPVRSLGHPDIGYFVFDPVSRRAGLVDAADDRLVRGLVETYHATLQWVVSTRNDEEGTRSLSRTADQSGAALIADGSFSLGRYHLECLPIGNLPGRVIRGPLALFTGRLIEAGDVPELAAARRREALDRILSILEPLPGRTRIYPSRGPLTTVWLERTFNSDLW